MKITNMMIKVLGLALLCCLVLLAQTQRTVTLTWDDLLNPAGTTYSIYRASGACTNPTYSVVASGITVKTYDDTNVSPGKYCYAATATYNSVESDKCVPVEVQVKPKPPQNFKGQEK